MTPEELLYQEAQDAINNNDKKLARDLLTRLLKLNRAKPEYWLWMSAVVETQKERGYCLKEVINLDPGNLLAIHGLRLLGEDLEYPGPTLTLNDLRQDWKTSLEVEQPKTASPHALRAKIFGYSMMGVLVVGLIFGGIYLALRPRQQIDNSPIKKWSLTPPVTATLDITPTPTFEGPVPLWTLLEATFTPTPLYVVTPHNRTEAYQVAMRAYYSSDWPRALEYFKQVLNDEPNSADIHYYIGEIYRFQGLPKSAIASYDAGIKLDPGFAPSYLGKGRAMYESTPRRLDEANANLQKALELDPLMTDVYLDLANVAIAQGEGDAALGWLDKAQIRLPENALVELARANAYILLGDNLGAFDAIQTANELDPSLLPVYKAWGKILQLNGEFTASITPLLTYLTYAPLDLESEVLLARAYAAGGDLEKALASVNISINADDKYQDALLTRGDIYMLQEENDLAAKDYEAVLRLNSRSFGGNIGKGRTLLAVTYSGLAYEYFQAAEKYAVTETETAIALYWRAIALIGLNETNVAIRLMETLLEYPEGVVPLALREEAVEAYLQIVTPTPSSTPTITRTPTQTPTVTLTPTPSSTSTTKPK